MSAFENSVGKETMEVEIAFALQLLRSGTVLEDSFSEGTMLGF